MHKIKGSKGVWNGFLDKKIPGMITNYLDLNFSIFSW
jgi:hypothetical protein